jgi:hypothetical protein
MTTPTHYRQCGAIGRPILLALGVPAELLDGKCEDMIGAAQYPQLPRNQRLQVSLSRGLEERSHPERPGKGSRLPRQIVANLRGSVPPDETLDMIRWLLQVSPR